MPWHYFLPKVSREMAGAARDCEEGVRRDEAIAAVLEVPGGPLFDREERVETLVNTLEALGLLKLDEPLSAEKVIAAQVIHSKEADEGSRLGTGWYVGPYGAARIIPALEGHGYKIERKA
jgi:hypothetical protein